MATREDVLALIDELQIDLRELRSRVEHPAFPDARNGNGTTALECAKACWIDAAALVGALGGKIAEQSDAVAEYVADTMLKWPKP